MVTGFESSKETASNIDDPFNTENASNTEIENFVKTWKTIAQEAELWNKDLWELFHGDFALFSVANFKELPKATRMMLRTFLYTRGVYVSPNNTLHTIGDTLYVCAQRGTPYKWTQEDIQTFKDGPQTAVSPWLAEQLGKLNHRSKMPKSPRQTSPAPLSPMYPTIPDLTDRLKTPVLPASTSALHLPPVPTPRNKVNTEPEEYYYQGPTNTTYGLAGQQSYHYPSDHTYNEQSYDPPNTNRTKGYANELALLDKIYPDSQKYDGFDGAFSHKLSIFEHYCRRADVPRVALLKAFPTMLKDMALNHFLTYEHAYINITFKRACEHMHGFFEGPEWQRSQKVKWQNTNLYQVMNETPNSSTSDCVRILVSTLQTLQHSLPDEMRGTSTLQDKLIMACENVPACGYGVAGPVSTLSELISRIQGSISMASFLNGAGPTTDTKTRYCYNCDRF